MDLKSRRVYQFRCHIDPMIGHPKNSFSMNGMPEAHFELTPIGVYVKMVIPVPNQKPDPMEFIVPFANIQSIKLMSPKQEEDYENAQKEKKLKVVA